MKSAVIKKITGEKEREEKSPRARGMLGNALNRGERERAFVYDEYLRRRVRTKEFIESRKPNRTFCFSSSIPSSR